MARPAKHKLDYFPLDVDFFNDYKLLMIEEDHGVRGGYLAIRLLAMVYEQGYFMEWKAKSDLSCAKRIGNGYNSAEVIKILDSCLNYGLFDRMLFEKKQILTSPGIQRRWIMVMQGLRRKTEISSAFNLLTSDETFISSEETAPPATFSTQKENKENQNQKEKENEKKVFIPPTLIDVVSYFVNEGYIPAAANKAYKYYHEANWHDSQGKKITNWKQKMQGVWFKPENLAPVQQKKYDSHDPDNKW
jgi:hypothetical protein